ncbi:hypothetical protein EGD00_16925 [Pectobacterium carotovorum subsp. carotovorum]|nr:hypothetical protein EGD00_16925 [Pectobacterium carotovorum subsp. carotovorum]
MKNKRKSKQDLLKRRLQQVATPLVAIVSGTIAGGVSGIGGGGVLPGLQADFYQLFYLIGQLGVCRK